MGYKCDVCEAAEGEVFCMADGGVMCKCCDVKVHTANKLARKHERVALNSTSQKPNCDICQEGKAVIFCIEDRAVMCRSCDLMVHNVNELTSKHQRFVIPSWQVGLSAIPCLGETELQQVDSQPAAQPQPSKPTPRKVQPEVKTREASVASRSDGSKSSSDAGVGQPGSKPSTSTAIRHTRQAADYSEYGALRALLGVPEVTGITPQQEANNSSSHSSAAAHSMPPASQPSVHTPPEQLLLPATTAAPLQVPLSTSQPTLGASQYQQSLAGASGSQTIATSSFPGDSFLPSTSAPQASPFVTLTAAELLGMPSVTGELSAKDIDAVYLPDAYTAFDDFDMDFSSLFEVPDLGPCTSDDFPLLGNPSTAYGKAPRTTQPGFDLGGDGVVPDMFAPEPSSKRHRGRRL